MLFQLARHNKELQALLKTYGEGDDALEFYAKHTAQIEVSHFSLIQESQLLWPCPCRCPLLALKSFYYVIFCFITPVFNMVDCNMYFVINMFRLFITLLM